MAAFRFPRLDPRIAADLHTQRHPIRLGLACSAINALLTGATLAMTKKIVDVVSKLNSNLTTVQQDDLLHMLVVYCLITVGVFAVRYVFSRGQMYLLSKAASRLSADLRIKLQAKLQRLPIGYIASKRSGAIQSVLTNDISIYQNAVSVIRDSIDGPIKAIVAVVVIVRYQPMLGLLAVILIPILGSVISRNSRKMRAAQTKVQDDLANVGATTQELLQGARVVKAFGAEAQTIRVFSTMVEESYASQMRTARLVSALRPLVELIGAAALVLFLYFSGLLAARHQLNVSDVAMLAMAMDNINQGFRSLAGVSNTFATVQAANDRLHNEILDVPEQHEVEGGITLSNLRGEIEFRGVSFRYPDGTEALHDVNFVLPPGRSLALVGPSGAGKSTVADLMLRFYEPTSGQILLDGHDIRAFDLAWYRSQIGVVPQQTFLFAGSIEDNLRLAKHDASDSEVEEALEMAHAKEFTAQMASRSDSQLGERGSKLSGGQMQRVAIARALIRKPTILLLDEATSALDATSEKIVTEALTEVMQSRTSLFIAHRLTTAARADSILVMSKGHVVETGSHASLMEQNGAYAGLFRAFSGGVLDA